MCTKCMDMLIVLRVYTFLGVHAFLYLVLFVSAPHDSGTKGKVARTRSHSVKGFIITNLAKNNSLESYAN